ncbi:MAG: serine--tRNA ligase [Candidatus Micrarchaeia archaeon]|jgi:seryl-tRNA synthetase
MLDLKFVRANVDVVRADLKKRNAPQKEAWLDEVLESDKRVRELSAEAERLRAKRNKASQEVNTLKKAGKETEAKQLIIEAAKIPAEIKGLEEEAAKLSEKITYYLMRLPNVLHESVPVGADDSGNAVLREWGNKPSFDFEPKGHVDLLESLGVADLEAAGNVAGARFYYLKNDLVMLDYALLKYGLDFLHKRGYGLIEPPYLMRREPYEGVTDLADFEGVMYKIEGEDLYLIATSEHPMAAMLANSILEPDQLPILLAGTSPCFRKEAGAHGKDTKGIFRVHQFQKIEQFIFCKPQESWGYHEKLIRNAEEYFQSLGIPYRVVSICTGDIGTVAAKKYDIEAWMPAQKTFREVVSCSNCTAYQAARLKIRFRKEKGGEEKEWVHTLNSTLVATSRAIVAILENFQRKDGTVAIPEVLWPYMNGVTELKPKK